MYNVSFYDLSEVRMASSFNVAKIKIANGYFPASMVDKAGEFQDKSLVTKSEELFLVQWDIFQGLPRFRVLKVSDAEKRVYRSKRLNGCCESLQIDEQARMLHVGVFGSENIVHLSLDDFVLYFDDQVEVIEETAETALNSFLGVGKISNLLDFVLLLKRLLKDGKIQEIRGSLTVSMLENHLNDLMKSGLDDEIVFQSLTSDSKYQFKINSGPKISCNLFLI